MGNSSSNNAESAPNEMEALETRVSPTRHSPTSRRSARTVSTAERELSQAFRQKGLCISYSDLGRVLNQHDNDVRAAFEGALSSKLVRKLAKVHSDGQGSQGSSSSVGGKAAVKLLAKRSRSDEADTSEGEQASKITEARPRRSGGRGGGGSGIGGGGRPRKRAVTVQGLSSFVQSGGGGGSPGSDFRTLPFRIKSGLLKKEVKLEGSPQTAPMDSGDRSSGGGSGGGMPADDTRGVLAALQQGSPPRQRLGRSRDVDTHESPRPVISWSPMPTGFAKHRPASSGGEYQGAFRLLPDKLNLARMGGTLAEAAERWAERTREQNEEAVRRVVRDLCIPDVTAERRNRLDSRLADLINAAMEDIAKMPGVKSRAAVLSENVRVGRYTINEVAVSVIGEYRRLYGKVNTGDTGIGKCGGGGDDDDDGSGSCSETVSIASDKIMMEDTGYEWPGSVAYSAPSPVLAPTSAEGSAASPGAGAGADCWPPSCHRRQERQVPARGPASRSPPPESTVSGSLISAFSAVRYFGAMSLAAAGAAPAAARRATPSPPPRPSRQRQRQQHTPVASMSVGDGGRTSSREQGREVVDAAKGAPGSGDVGDDEDSKFENARCVCECAVKMAKAKKREERWLEGQMEVVTAKADQIELEIDEDLRKSRDEEEEAEKALEEASQALREATEKVIRPHALNDPSVEMALISLLDYIDESPAELGARRKVKTTMTEAKVSLMERSAHRVLVKHAANILRVLRNELFGDLLDSIHEEKQRARDRRLASQEKLLSTAKEALDRLKAAVRTHVAKVNLTEKNMRKIGGTLRENQKLLSGLSFTQSLQDQYSEQQEFKENSLKIMKEIVEKARKLSIRVEKELQGPQWDHLVEYGKRSPLGEPGDTTDGVAVKMEEWYQREGGSGSGDECCVM